MKIKFNSADNLLQKKPIDLYNMVIVVRSIFMKTTNIIRKFSQMNVCINYKCYNMIGLMCLTELILTKPLVWVITGTFLRKILDFSKHM